MLNPNHLRLELVEKLIEITGIMPAAGYVEQVFKAAWISYEKLRDIHRLKTMTGQQPPKATYEMIVKEIMNVKVPA